MELLEAICIDLKVEDAMEVATQGGPWWLALHLHASNERFASQ
jgi:hypothetical protein